MSDCINHTGYFNDRGYGIVRIAGKAYKAHRLAAERKFGMLGEQLVRHTCDNPACVNPDHLVLGDHADNMRDMAVRGRAIKKLSQDSVDDVRRMRASGSLLREIAEKHSCSIATVSLICRGLARKHL